MVFTMFSAASCMDLLKFLNTQFLDGKVFWMHQRHQNKGDFQVLIAVQFLITFYRRHDRLNGPLVKTKSFHISSINIPTVLVRQQNICQEPIVILEPMFSLISLHSIQISLKLLSDFSINIWSTCKPSFELALWDLCLPVSW